MAAFKRLLLPRASVLTPNAPEAAVLAGMAVDGIAAARAAAEVLLTLGIPAVLLKGGHLPGDSVIDLLATEDALVEYAAPRLPGRHTHGTGCTLASAIAARLAQGAPLARAIADARAYVRAAIEAAPGLGGGHGPLGHDVTVRPDAIAAVLGA